MISIKWTGKKKMGRADESHDMSHILHIGKNPLDSWTEELGLVLIRGYDNNNNNNNNNDNNNNNNNRL